MGDRLVRWTPYVLLGAVLAWVARIAAAPISDPDDWWHLRLGNDLISQHTLSTPSHWSSFATVSWVPTEPLPEIVSAYVERWFGLPGLAWLFGLGALLVAVTVQLGHRREAALLPATVATVFTLLAASGSLTSRPQLVSFVLLPILLAAWFQTERDLVPRWWLVPMTWAWSLCHGFWFIGVAYGFVFVVGIALSRRATPGVLARLAVLAVACFVVVALNPVGFGVLEAPFRVQSTAGYIQEWQRTHLLQSGPLGAVLMVVVTALVWAVTRRGVSWVRVLLLLSAAFWIWYAGRTVIVGGLVAGPLFAAALGTLIPDADADADADDRSGRHRVSRPELGLVAGWAAVCLVVLAVVVPHTSDEPGDVPTGLDAQLDRLPHSTPVLNAYELGGWITWRHPDLNQYIDGLITPYSTGHAADYVQAESEAPGWYGVVRSSGAPAALLLRNSALASGLEAKGWTVSGTDDDYVLLLEPGYSLAPSS